MIQDQSGYDTGSDRKIFRVKSSLTKYPNLSSGFQKFSDKKHKMSPYLCRLWRRKMLRQQHGTAAGGGGCRRQPKKAAVPPKKAHGVCRPGRDKLSEGKLQRRLSRRRDAAKRQELLRQQQKKAAVGGERSREAAKDLIGLVRSYHVCALIRGLENLESSLGRF